MAKLPFSEIKFPSRLFITGTGTDVGKSWATGWLAREMNQAGLKTITQKFVQTGNDGFSEDIELHRRIMQCGILPEDTEGLTAPEIFTYPASPHLAAEIDRRPLDLGKIDSATAELATRYEHVLIEGAGGILVPLTQTYLTADYIAERNLPAAVVINGQLGSINHVLLTLLAVKHYGIKLFALIYNPWFDADKTICTETKRYLRNRLAADFPDAHWLEMPGKMVL